MKVEVRTRIGEYDETNAIEMSINGKDAYSVGDLYECPEDATLGRDLSFAFSITNFMKKAFNAGKNGEVFTLIEKQVKEEDW